MGINGSIGDTLTMVHQPPKSSAASSAVSGAATSTTATAAHGKVNVQPASKHSLTKCDVGASSTGQNAPYGTQSA
jgi:hypothetical protein